MTDAQRAAVERLNEHLREDKDAPYVDFLVDVALALTAVHASERERDELQMALFKEKAHRGVDNAYIEQLEARCIELADEAQKAEAERDEWKRAESRAATQGIDRAAFDQVCAQRDALERDAQHLTAQWDAALQQSKSLRASAIAVVVHSNAPKAILRQKIDALNSALGLLGAPRVEGGCPFCGQRHLKGRCPEPKAQPPMMRLRAAHQPTHDWCRACDDRGPCSVIALLDAADAMARALALEAKCRLCGGKGEYLPSCSLCDDSGEDHECPGWRKCDKCGGTGRRNIPALSLAKSLGLGDPDGK